MDEWLNKTKLWKLWLIWLGVIALVGLGMLVQIQQQANWHPDPSSYVLQRDVEAPGEGFDVIILFWVFVGGIFLLMLLARTVDEAWGAFKKKSGRFLGRRQEN